MQHLSTDSLIFPVSPHITRRSCSGRKIIEEFYIRKRVKPTFASTASLQLLGCTLFRHQHNQLTANQSSVRSPASMRRRFKKKIGEVRLVQV